MRDLVWIMEHPETMLRMGFRMESEEEEEEEENKDRYQIYSDSISEHTLRISKLKEKKYGN